MLSFYYMVLALIARLQAEARAAAQSVAAVRNKRLAKDSHSFMFIDTTNHNYVLHVRFIAIDFS
jgi:hypothetical protein